MQGQINFLSKQHAARMLKLILQTEKYNKTNGKVDIEYGTAFYLLTSYEDVYKKALPYIGDGIQFKTMMAKQDFSTGEKVIVKLAANLFNGNNKNIAPIDVVGHLDNNLFEIAICAMRMRYYQGLTLKSIQVVDED